jgi:hypothetical protein
MSRAKYNSILSAAVVLSFAAAARGGSLDTIAVVGSTVMPSTGGAVFESIPFFTSDLSTDGTDVVFTGTNSNATAGGVFDYNLNTHTLNAASTLGGASPDGGTYNSSGLAQEFPSIGNGRVAFFANTSVSANGIFAGTSSGGAQSVIADTSTSIPSGGGATFHYVENPTSQSGSNLIFEGWNASNSVGGLYASNGGTLSKIVDYNTSVPNVGGTTFAANGFNNSSVSGNVVAFTGIPNQAGYNGYEGIYSTTLSGATPTFVAAANAISTTGASLMPGTSSYLQGLGFVGTDGKSIVAWGYTNGSTNNSGLFLYPVAGGTGTVIMNGSTQVPGTNQFFSPSDTDTGYCISNGIVTFNGENATTNAEGIYAWENGTIVPVIAPGQAVTGDPAYAGYTWTYAELMGQGTANGIADYAFYGTMTDGSNTISGVFADPVPEPCSLALLGLGSLLVLRRRQSARA